VLRWITEGKFTEFRRRDAFDQLRDQRLQKVTDLDPALELLLAHGYVARIAVSRGPGRPSVRFRVNPLSQNPQNTQNQADPASIAGSAGSALRRQGAYGAPRQA
jgi:hypothetical protein